MKPVLRLDEWYRHINSMYLDRNFYRAPESIFVHLAEVVGGLSLVASGKEKPGVVPEVFLAKSVGWWMALCGKVGVRSVEAMLWTKFPYACPYCQQMPHSSPKCRQARSTSSSPHWTKLADIGRSNLDKKPAELSSWQKMFYDIYPRDDQTTHEKNFSRLAEELGELGETIRILPITRTYFLSEAADVFAWLMGEANQMDFQKKYPGDHGTFLVRAMSGEYPERCKYCQSQLCKCPPVLSTALGRLSHDVPTSAFQGEEGGNLFTVEEAQEFFRVGDEEIKLAGREFSVNSEIIKEVLEAVHALQKLVLGQYESQGDVEARLTVAIKELADLASQQKVTQSSVDELVQVLNELPSERRRIATGLLTSAGSGIFIQALLHILRG